ncbi:MAG TPA: tRNA (adenosine(37)-N6)-threonylcarbamoyltransferase complex ATPase subunit type 1 TsaE [Armatimonadota bacterium]|jgi:tRNA threonylcarbamoyladenosine biosynthesis protein TsaE
MTQSPPPREIKLTCYTDSPEQTRELARRLAAYLRPGDFLALCGELGGGKTCFVQGLAEGLGALGRVSSPTFVLLHYHPGPLPLCHLDAYRVASAEEFRDLGVDDYARTGVVALEWADRLPELWPAELLIVNFSYTADGRCLELSGRGERWSPVLEELSCP